MFDEQMPRLEGLLALSSTRGLDMRPTLLRVLTDIFVEAPHPSPNDIERYGELAGHLVDQVDPETRAIVAAKLGPCLAAPRIVIDKLIASETEAVEHIVAVSPTLTRDDLWTLATDGGPVTAAAIARRPDIDLVLAHFLVRKNHILIAEALIANPRAPLDREIVTALAEFCEGAPELAGRLSLRQGVEAAWLAPCFLQLDRSTRHAILEAYAAESRASRLALRDAQIMAPELVLDALERAALSGNIDELVAGLAGLFAVSEDMAGRIVADSGGEPLALALAAIGMEIDRAARVLMFASPEAGRSVAGLRDLVTLMETMPRQGTTRLIRAITRAPVAHAETPQHEPLFSESNPVRQATTRRRRTRTPKAKAIDKVG